MFNITDPHPYILALKCPQESVRVIGQEGHISEPERHGHCLVSRHKGDCEDETGKHADKLEHVGEGNRVQA